MKTPDQSQSMTTYNIFIVKFEHVIAPNKEVLYLTQSAFTCSKLTIVLVFLCDTDLVIKIY